MKSMPSDPAIISADGKLLVGGRIEGMKVGETLRLVIDGNRMIGGADSPTLLENGQTFLPSSHQFELKELLPQTDGTCRLSYTLINRLPE